MREEMMDNTKNINGRTSDIFTRERIADIASDLCPVHDNDARMTYAELILSWVMRGKGFDARYARTQSVEQAYQNHRSSVYRDKIPGVDMDFTMVYPDFEIEAEKILRFIGGGS
jgi:hypothetical protein